MADDDDLRSTLESILESPIGEDSASVHVPPLISEPIYTGSARTPPTTTPEPTKAKRQSWVGMVGVLGVVVVILFFTYRRPDPRGQPLTPRSLERYTQNDDDDDDSDRDALFQKF